MPVPKAKPPKQIPAEIPDNYPLERLQEMFDDFVQSVEAQIDAEGPEQAATHKAAAVEAVGNALVVDDFFLPERLKEAQVRRDALAAFIFALEMHEQRLRQAVKYAETLARRYKTRADFFRGGIYQYMLDREISRVEGFIHRFSIAKLPDQLVIIDETEIPSRFFDEVPTTSRVLNKERLLTELRQEHSLPLDGDTPTGHTCTCGKRIENYPEWKAHKEEIRVSGAYLETNRSRLDVK